MACELIRCWSGAMQPNKRRRWIVKSILVVLPGLMLVRAIAAQEASPPFLVITADNFHRLQSVAHIDFVNLTGRFITGWFAMDETGSRFAVLYDDNRSVYVLDAKSNILDMFSPCCGETGGMIYDIAFSDTATWAVVDGDVLWANYLSGSHDAYPLPDFVAQALWLNGDYLWLEGSHSHGDAGVIRLPVPGGSVPNPQWDVYPYAPAADPEAVVRTGRIPPPYVVTSSATGLVKLWHLETGTVLAEVDNGSGKPAVFGNINADATHLVWRDEMSEKLYLLNFATGENRTIGDLNGEYVQWFFLSPKADVILGVNQNFEPVVIAWDVATGERTVLGEYRPCNRPQPDMIRFSHDGTTLAIGCDTGLDIWRVVADSGE